MGNIGSKTATTKSEQVEEPTTTPKKTTDEKVNGNDSEQIKTEATQESTAATSDEIVAETNKDEPVKDKTADPNTSTSSTLKKRNPLLWVKKRISFKKTSTESQNKTTTPEEDKTTNEISPTTTSASADNGGDSKVKQDSEAKIDTPANNTIPVVAEVTSNPTFDVSPTPDTSVESKSQISDPPSQVAVPSVEVVSRTNSSSSPTKNEIQINGVGSPLQPLVIENGTKMNGHESTGSDDHTLQQECNHVQVECYQSKSINQENASTPVVANEEQQLTA